MRYEEAAGEEERGKGVVPNTVGGEIDGERIKCPAESGDCGDTAVESAASEIVEGSAGKGGDEAI